MLPAAGAESGPVEILTRSARCDPARTVTALLGLGTVFPPEFADDAWLVATLTGWLRALGTSGAAAVVASVGVS